jgi:hypothetical protein
MLVSHVRLFGLALTIGQKSISPPPGMRAAYSYPGTQVGLGALRGGCALAKLSSTPGDDQGRFESAHGPYARPRRTPEEASGGRPAADFGTRAHQALSTGRKLTYRNAGSM